VCAGNTKGGSITVPLTSCLTGLESAVLLLTIFCFYLQNRLIQTSEIGGQGYSDTSPFSIPWCVSFLSDVFCIVLLFAVMLSVVASLVVLLHKRHGLKFKIETNKLDSGFITPRHSA